MGHRRELGDEIHALAAHVKEQIGLHVEKTLLLLEEIGWLDQYRERLLENSRVGLPETEPLESNLASLLAKFREADELLREGA